jgi:hypothetical protein
MLRGFAQLGGTSTYHYLAKCMGIRGYATVLVEDLIGPGSADLVADVAQIDGIDTVLDLRVHLQWLTENRVVHCLSNSPEEVQATLIKLEPEAR